MPLEENDAGYLWDMLEAARGVATSLQDLTLEQYQTDENLRLATERRIEIVRANPLAGAKLPAVFRSPSGKPILRFPGDR